MIALGIALLIVGVAVKDASVWTIAILLVIAGLTLAFLGSTGRPVGGRRHYF
ncbi:MAG TPA: hypothetical protein VHZ96_04640 [Frankiaceae bacterium]|nr:hypothetical protein [Frankiaceae bacterium]